jgi:hypothetical protein
MQALTYHGSKDVRVETVPDPARCADNDIIQIADPSRLTLGSTCLQPAAPGAARDLV